MKLTAAAMELALDPLTFDNRIDKVRGHIAQHFHLAARPPDFHFVHFGFRSQAKVQARIVL